MIQKVFERYPFSGLACLALILFGSVFVVVVFRSCFGEKARSVQRLAERLPLADEIGIEPGVLG